MALDYEKHIASYFQAAGYYIERRLKDPIEQLFELDVLAIDFRKMELEEILIECKGGEEKTKDLFKQIGIMNYLGIKRGIYTANPQDDRIFREKCAIGQKCNIKVIPNYEKKFLKKVLIDNGFMKEGISDRLCYHWENVFSVEDEYRRILTNKTLWDKYESIRKAKSCFQATNNKI